MHSFIRWIDASLSARGLSWVPFCALFSARDASGHISAPHLYTVGNLDGKRLLQFALSHQPFANAINHLSARRVVRHPTECIYSRNTHTIRFIPTPRHKQFLFRRPPPFLSASLNFFALACWLPSFCVFFYFCQAASERSVINERTFIIPFPLLMIVAGLKWQGKKMYIIEEKFCAYLMCLWCAGLMNLFKKWCSQSTTLPGQQHKSTLLEPPFL